MTDNAVRVFTALADCEQSETELALSAGLSLAETRSALDQLSLTGAITDQVFDGVRLWRLSGKDA